jgi:MFS family permease
VDYGGGGESGPKVSRQLARIRACTFYLLYLSHRLDFYLMPLLVLGFFVLQLDRGNISNALTDTITQDLGISNDDVNLGSQLMLAGIVVAELPSNMLLQRVGAPVWLTGQMGIWGTIALTQAWVTNKSSFFATRFILGIFEGGYVPGGQYMLSLFYTREELATRTSIFYFGNYFAAATGSLMAAGILKLAGTNGLSGWQWLFISKPSLVTNNCCSTNTFHSKLRAS